MNPQPLPERETDPPADTSPELCRDFADLLEADEGAAIGLLSNMALDPDAWEMFAKADAVAFLKMCGRLDEKAVNRSLALTIARVK